MKVWAVGLAVALFASQAVAQIETTVDVQPDWKRKPTPANIMSVFPKAALKAGIGGRAMLYCKVSALGALFDCKVVSERPEGMGFGGAALTMSTQFILTPAMKGGKPVDFDGVQVPVIFPAYGTETGSHIQGPGTTAARTEGITRQVPWISGPSLSDIYSAIPQKARDLKVGGHISLECIFKADGRLGQCSRLSEDVGDVSFYTVARKLSEKFQAPSTFTDGKPVKGIHVILPFTFSVEQEVAPTFSVKLPWVSGPSGSDFEQEFAPVLKAAQVKTIQIQSLCNIGSDGRLTGCTTVSLNPRIEGAEQAMSRIAARFQAPVWTDQGTTYVGGKVLLPLRYNLP